MIEILEERPKTAVVTRTMGKYAAKITHSVMETEDGRFECDSETVVYDYKPTVTDIREVLIRRIDTETDERILSGFTWNGLPVYLSKESQFNFKAAYDLAIQTGGANLPIKFKLGEDAEKRPVYYDFTSIAEFMDFFVKAMDYINITLNEGWARKDSIVIDDYE